MKEREDKFKTHRLLQIDKEIRGGGYPSVDKLMNTHGVSRRTILRDIEFLRDRYDAPLEYDAERKGYFYSDPTFMIRNVLLTEGDLFTVSTVLPLLEQYKNTPLEGSFRNIMEKITEMLPDQVSVDASFLNKDISFISDPLPKIDEDVFYAVFRAVKSFERIRFGYRSSGSRDYKDKRIDCYHIICQKGSWYVIGFNPDAEDGKNAGRKGSVRVYAIARMRGIEFTGELFTVPEDFDVGRHIDLSFGIWNNPEPPTEYELLFCPATANYISEREWHKDQSVTRNEDGSVTLCFKSNQKQVVRSWVLGFGSAVRVLRPKELADSVREEALKVAAMYGDTL